MSTVGIVLESSRVGRGVGDLILVVPPFDRILASTTVQRALAVMPAPWKRRAGRYGSAHPTKHSCRGVVRQ